MSHDPQALSRLGGVGIVFVKDQTDCIYVNLLVKGGPAHRSGQIQQGKAIAPSLRHMSECIPFSRLRKTHGDARNLSWHSPDSPDCLLVMWDAGDLLRYIDGMDLRAAPRSGLPVGSFGCLCVCVLVFACI